MIQRSLEEHREVDQILEGLNELQNQKGGKGFADNVKILERKVLTHIEEEEGKLFPRVEEQV